MLMIKSSPKKALQLQHTAVSHAMKYGYKIIAEDTCYDSADVLLLSERENHLILLKFRFKKLNGVRTLVGFEIKE